ncbi:MAG TPA: tetratricopeptide repeat protein [Bacteroidota bacterium]|nr:tetratricopeptide repeat protein [Bacteroidota bacterium]
MKHLVVVIALASLFAAGCSKESEQSLWRKVEASRVNNNPDSTLMACRQILKDYPQGTLAPGALYMIAETYYRVKRDPRTAAGYYREFVAKYPDLVQTPVAMFLIGFIYNNSLGNTDSARIGYEQFLAKYPHHDLSQSAQFELDNLGKSADEILSDKQPKPKAKKK